MNELPTAPNPERGATSPPRSTHDHVVDTELVDLTDLPLAELGALDESVLAHSLRRIVQEAGSDDTVVAGHSVSV